MDWMPAIALAMLMIGLFAWLRADIMGTRKELRAEIAEQVKILRAEIAEQVKILRAEITQQGKTLRGETTEQGNTLRGEISLLRQEVGRLRERMAHMEGLLEGLREAISGKQVA